MTRVGTMRIFESKEKPETLSSFRPSSRSGNYDEESRLLISHTPHDRENEGEDSKRLSPSFKVASIVAIIFSLFLGVLGVFVYRPFEIDRNLNMKPNMFEEVAPVSTTAAVELSKVYDLCELNSRGQVWKTCPYKTTRFIVDGNENGCWPIGFSWTVLKDPGDTESGEKTFLYSEKGKFDVSSKATEKIKCKKFVTELCLAGNYVVYANSENPSSIASSVNVCDKKVIVDEALDFSTDHVRCVSSQYELDPKRFTYDEMSQRPKITIMQVASSLSMATTSLPPIIASSSPTSSPTKSSAPTPLYQKFLPPPPSYEPSPAPSGPSPVPTPFFRPINLTDIANDVNETFVKRIPILFNETMNGFKYPTFEPTFAPTPIPLSTGSLTNSSGNVTCWMMGLICSDDLEKLGITNAPSGMPSLRPTMIDGEPMPSKKQDFGIFGFLFPATTSPTPEPTNLSPLNILNETVEQEIAAPTARL